MNYLFLAILSVVVSAYGKYQEQDMPTETYSIADLLDANDLHYTVQDQEIDGERVPFAIDIRDERVHSLQGLQEIPGIERCKELSIRFTQIPVITEQEFEGLSELTRLTITNNPILHAIKPRSFAPLSQLRYLDLSHNDRLMLRMGIFEGLPSLQELDISNRHMRMLPMGWSKGLDNLKIIYTRALGNLLIQKAYKDLNGRMMLAKRGYKVRIIRRRGNH